MKYYFSCFVYIDIVECHVQTFSLRKNLLGSKRKAIDIYAKTNNENGCDCWFICMIDRTISNNIILNIFMNLSAITWRKMKESINYVGHGVTCLRAVCYHETYEQHMKPNTDLDLKSVVIQSFLCINHFTSVLKILCCASLKIWKII